MCGMITKCAVQKLEMLPPCTFGTLVTLSVYSDSKLNSQLILLFDLLLLLFISSTVFFGTIHESYCIISVNFNIYLQYFQQNVFSFSKVISSQTDTMFPFGSPFQGKKASLRFQNTIFFFFSFWESEIAINQKRILVLHHLRWNSKTNSCFPYITVDYLAYCPYIALSSILNSQFYQNV